MEFTDNLIHKIDLDNNMGLSSYSGMAAQQHHNSYEVFYNFLKKEKPSQILEIGTGLGGLTQFLHRSCKDLDINCRILSYEVNPGDHYADMISSGIDVRIENTFSNNYTSVDQFVIEFIRSSGTTIVLCDGGSKKQEFNLLSNYIKDGDFILAHDYGYDLVHFEQYINGRVWNWFEIQESDIIDACNLNNLKDYERKTFNNVAWVCKTK